MIQTLRECCALARQQYTPKIKDKCADGQRIKTDLNKYFLKTCVFNYDEKMNNHVSLSEIIFHMK